MFKDKLSYLTPIRVATIKKKRQKMPSIGKNLRNCALMMKIQNGAATIENSMVVLQKIKIELPDDPSIPLLGIHPQTLKEVF